MPARCKTTYNAPRCPHITEEHWRVANTDKNVTRTYEARRSSSAKRGYCGAWRKLGVVAPYNATARNAG